MDATQQGALTRPGPSSGEPAGSGAIARSPGAAAHSGWTGGRITAVLIGALLTLIASALLVGGGVALWADRTQRDPAGYVTTGVREFSTAGSALATERIDLDSPGVDWLYSGVVLGEVRIRVTPASDGRSLFVGIGPSDDVDRYLAGVSHTRISNFWRGRTQAIGGGTLETAPGTQDFWVASATGATPRTVVWDPANGSWTVVVMSADGGPGIHVAADLGATMPALSAIAVGSLVAGAVLLAAGVLLVAGAIRRANHASGH